MEHLPLIIVVARLSWGFIAFGRLKAGVHAPIWGGKIFRVRITSDRFVLDEIGSEGGLETLNLEPEPGTLNF
jgi:hypothetical protein